MNLMKRTLLLAGIIAGANALAIDFFELEPNDSRATANVVAGMAAGDRIIGNSTSATGVGLDYYRVSTAAASLGIYRYRLALTTSGTAGHTGTIRSMSQVAAPPDTMPGVPWDGVFGATGTTEGSAQSSSSLTTPPRFNQWYGFGRSEEMYYRVAGTTSTTANYESTLDRQLVTPTDIGTYEQGLITMNWNGQGHTSDTDMWVYDANLNAIAGYGNDDSSAALGGAPIATTSFQSWLARNYAVGRYYIGLSNFQLTNGMGSPSDDNFRTGAMLEFPGVVVNSSTSTNVNMTFTITDSLNNSLQVANTKAGAYDVNWFTFNVVPEPSTIIGCLAGLGLLAFRRFRK